MKMKPVMAIVIGMAAFAITEGADAVPLLPRHDTARHADVTLLTRAQSKSGSVTRSTGQLRTFRPVQVPRLRPIFGRNTVRPINRQLANRKRLRRPRHIHVAGGAPSEVPPAIYEDNTREHVPLSPDFCRYWSDRGVVIGDLEPCW